MTYIYELTPQAASDRARYLKIKDREYYDATGISELYYLGSDITEEEFLPEDCMGYVQLSERNDFEAYIEMLSVPDDWKGFGIGKRLMNRVCQDADILHLDLSLTAHPLPNDDGTVDPDKINWLVKFYESFGFEITDIREPYANEDEEWTEEEKRYTVVAMRRVAKYLAVWDAAEKAKYKAQYKAQLKAQYMARTAALTGGQS